MNENIVQFPSPEGAKIGLYEMGDLSLKLTNVFDQTADSDRRLSDAGVR